jgi:hypothetical protein
LLKRLVKLRAPVGNLKGVFLVVGERAFQFLKLNREAILILLALGG